MAQEEMQSCIRTNRDALGWTYYVPIARARRPQRARRRLLRTVHLPPARARRAAGRARARLSAAPQWWCAQGAPEPRRGARDQLVGAVPEPHGTRLQLVSAAGRAGFAHAPHHRLSPRPLAQAPCRSVCPPCMSVCLSTDHRVGLTLTLTLALSLILTLNPDQATEWALLLQIEAAANNEFRQHQQDLWEEVCPHCTARTPPPSLPLPTYPPTYPPTHLLLPVPAPRRPPASSPPSLCPTTPPRPTSASLTLPRCPRLRRRRCTHRQDRHLPQQRSAQPRYRSSVPLCPPLHPSAPPLHPICTLSATSLPSPPAFLRAPLTPPPPTPPTGAALVGI